MTGRATSRFSWKRTRLLLAVVALLALVAGPAAVNGTLAGWTDSKMSRGEFQAGSLNISDLKCSDNSVILTLLGTELQLDWEPPAGVESGRLTYEVTVVKRYLLTSETFKYETSDESFVYKETAGLLNLATYEMTVRAKSVGQWSGQPMTVNGYALTRLILRCN